MPDQFTPEERSRIMRLVKGSDTSVEIKLRSALHRKGYRFRKNFKELAGKPDIAFTRCKLAIFVDGEFWHGYKFEAEKDSYKPYWREKIARNMERDKKYNHLLSEQGWKVMRFWGRQIEKDLDHVVAEIEEAYKTC